MHVPILRETVTLAYLAGIAVPIRPVVPFNKGCVDGLADHRVRQRRHYPQYGTEDHAEVHLHNPPLLPRLVYRGVLQLRRRHFVGGLGTARFARVRRHHRRAIGVENRGFVGGVCGSREEIQRPATRAGLEVLDHLLDVLRAPLAGHDTDDQPVRGIQRDMIPIVALLGVGGLLGITRLFFLAHEGPLFVALYRARLRGKPRPTRRAGRGRACPPARRSAPPSRGSLPRGAQSCAPHSPRRYGRVLTLPSPPATVPERGVCLCVRRSGHDNGGSRAAAGACPGRSAYTPSDSTRPVCRRRRRPYSGSKIGRDPPWSVLPNLSLLGHTSLPRGQLWQTSLSSSITTGHQRKALETFFVTFTPRTPTDTSCRLRWGGALRYSHGICK